MSKTFKIKLTPVDNYFLGSDRTFHYGEEDRNRAGRSEYFIKSEILPLQTSLFGVIRYLGIKDKQADYGLTEEDKANIGNYSFAYDNESQNFGKIKSISPLYIEQEVDGKNRLLIKTPRDHKIGDVDSYHPFEEYVEVFTSLGKRYLMTDFDAKKGIDRGFISIDDHKLVDVNEIFSMDEKTGIRIEQKEKAYYKMGYRRMEKSSFVFYATVEDYFPEISDKIVYMGARKSAFTVCVTREEEPKVEIDGTKIPGMKKVYFLSDSYVKEEDMQIINDKAVSMNLSTRTARGYMTNYGKQTQRNRFKKTDCLYRLIEAGSIIIIPQESETEVKKVIENEHMQIVGCNRIVVGG